MATQRRKLNSVQKETDSDIKRKVLQNFAKTNLDNDMTAEKIEAIFTHNGVVP